MARVTDPDNSKVMLQLLVMVGQVLVMVVQVLIKVVIDRVTMGSGKLANIVFASYTMVMAIEEAEVVGQRAIIMSPLTQITAMENNNERAP